MDWIIFWNANDFLENPSQIAYMLFKLSKEMAAFKEDHQSSTFKGTGVYSKFVKLNPSAANIIKLKAFLQIH